MIEPQATASAEVLLDTLRLVLPYLPPELGGPESLARLELAGRALAPSLPGMFECRLGSGANPVDLLQRIPRDEGYPPLLRAHIQANGQLAEPEWRRVHEFCEAWSEANSRLFSGITNIWLEFDLDSDAAAQAPVPSVFPGFNTGLAPAPDILELLQAALPLLLGAPVSAPVWASVERCARACPEGAIISHVGVMLARPAAGLRINVARLARAQFLIYLQEVGWDSGLVEVEQLADWAYGNAEWVTLCLDVGQSVYPKLGLECSFEPGQPRDQMEQKWAALLGECIARGVCTPAERSALLAWPGAIDPMTAWQPWPGHLIGRSLVEPDHLIFVQRWLSHVKLVYQPGQPLQAKAYLGFEAHWL